MRDRRGVDVEVAPPEPVGIRRAEVVGQLQLLVLVELHADDAVAEAAGHRIELRVAGAEEHPALGIDGRAAASPQAAARGNERAGAARGQVERIERVRQAAAALRRGGVDDAVVQVERVGLAAAGDELLRRRDILPSARLTWRSRPSHETA